MTFDEIQLILQQIVISQQQAQAEMQELRSLARSNGQAIQAMLDQSATDRQQAQAEMQELRSLARSNGQAIQAMLDQSATDRLKREAEAAEHRERMDRLERISEALVNMSVSIDEDRPTILRKLNNIEQKTTDILDRLSSDRST